MKSISKLSEDWATAYRTDSFFKARLKLTGYYTAGIFLIILSYSFLLYGLFSKNTPQVELPETGREAFFDFSEGLMENDRENLRDIIILLDTLSFFLVLILSYYLAGKTIGPLKKSYLKQKKFISDSAHELKTPLTVIKAGMQAVAIGPQELKEYEKINREMIPELDHLIELVNDLLLLEKSGAIMKITFEDLDLSTMLCEQLEFMSSYAQNLGIKLNGEIEKGVFLKGNRVYLKRMINNLLKNAADYNKPGGEIKVKLEKKELNVIISVKDTGIGISPEEQEAVFDRFYKARKNSPDNTNGTGLGLSIVKEIVENHGGKVSLSSEPDKGTVVSVLLPLP